MKFGDDRERYGATYKIVNAKRSLNGSRQWKAVGSVVDSNVTLHKDFWGGETDQPQHKSTLRVVVVEDEPLLSAYQVDGGGYMPCLLSHKCSRYIAVSENSSEPQAYWLEQGCCRGYLIDLLRSLERDLSVHADAYLVKDGKYGAMDPSTKQWNGLVEDLIDGKADVAVAAMSISEMRSRVIDFSNSFLAGQTKILISTRDIEHVYDLGFQFLDPFSFHLWLVTLLYIILVVIVVWCLEKCSPFGHKRTSNRDGKAAAFSLAVCISYIWSNFCKFQVEDATPRSLSARFATAVFSFASLILTTTYTANLAASLVSSEERNIVAGIMDPKVRQKHCCTLLLN